PVRRRKHRCRASPARSLRSAQALPSLPENRGIVDAQKQAERRGRGAAGPRRLWATQPAESRLVPECWNNEGATAHPSRPPESRGPLRLPVAPCSFARLTSGLSYRRGSPIQEKRNTRYNLMDLTRANVAELA